MTGHATTTRVLVDKADVIDRVNRLRDRAIQRDGDYWDGYVVGLEDLLDALYGYCHPDVAIQEAK